jgi:hypothetical protein
MFYYNLIHGPTQKIIETTASQKHKYALFAAKWSSSHT